MKASYLEAKIVFVLALAAVACFGRVVQKHTVTVNGVEQSQKYVEGESVTVEAPAPEKGMKFEKWSATAVTLEDVTANPVTFVMPDADVSLVASYVEKPIADHFVDVEIKQGWGMYAFDFQPVEESIKMLCSLGDMMVWNGFRFVRADEKTVLEAGHGFFLYSAAAKNVKVWYNGEKDMKWIESLPAGWNLIPANYKTYPRFKDEANNYIREDDISETRFVVKEFAPGTAVWYFK